MVIFVVTLSDSKPIVFLSDELHCSFESPDLCGFTQDPTDDGDLVHMSGKTDSFYTGPSFDHTFFNSSGTLSFSNFSNRLKIDRVIGEHYQPLAEEA